MKRDFFEKSGSMADPETELRDILNMKAGGTHYVAPIIEPLTRPSDTIIIVTDGDPLHDPR